MKELKVVAVGDLLDCIKTRFLNRYVLDDLSEFKIGEYYRSCFEEATLKIIRIDNQNILLRLSVTSGMENLSNLLRKTYLFSSDIDLFLVFFKQDDKKSFENI
jgi:hypothetical protein